GTGRLRHWLKRLQLTQSLLVPEHQELRSYNAPWRAILVNSGCCVEHWDSTHPQNGEIRLSNDKLMTNDKGPPEGKSDVSSFIIRSFWLPSMPSSFPHVYLSTSSTVVSPAKMLRKPSWRSVTIPSSTAFCFKVTVGARSLISSRIGSVSLNSS